ncbi:hypothetical protein BHE74_00002736 [Ensete ventricosum]|nr:hypothetical protein GW17_00002179 [Ensete ventricosum]RWW88387.1 hypothetical protein BHE74_00002736 [Ensete ventricosum]RZS24539.1 hypothetical protein BHM03_00057617 [Ensete ventricosum]
MSAETLLSKAEGTSKDGISSTEHKKEGIWISISTWTSEKGRRKKEGRNHWAPTGQPIQHCRWGSHSASRWKPSSAGFSSKHFDIPFPSACLLPSILHNEYL